MAMERRVRKTGKDRDGDITSLCNDAGSWSPRSRRELWNVGLWVACLLALGCSDSTAPCDICTTQGLAYGQVVDSEGQPVEGIKVEVYLSANPCTASLTGPSFGHLHDPAFTDPTGVYRARTISIYSPFTALCAVVTANALEDPAWTVVVDTLPTHLEFREDGAPPDSARYDMVVEAQSGG